MELDYKAIGRRIREYRGKCGYSQEKLAELANLSVPHVSHIETANTKLSLPVLVQIANTLHVTPNDLLCDSVECSAESYHVQIEECLDGCDVRELRIISEIVRATVSALRKNSR